MNGKSVNRNAKHIEVYNKHSSSVFGKKCGDKHFTWNKNYLPLHK